MSLYSITPFYDAIQNEQYFQIGSFKKPIGIDGSLVASFLDPFNHTELVNLPALFVEIDAIKVPYSIKNIIATERKTVIQLHLIQSKTAAYALRNLPLFLPITLQPKWVQATLPYSLVDGLVEEVVLGQLGKIEAIYVMRDQYMLAVNYLDKELLIPYCKPFLIHVDEAQKKVTIELPEGYLEAML